MVFIRRRELYSQREGTVNSEMLFVLIVAMSICAMTTSRPIALFEGPWSLCVVSKFDFILGQ
jgi:hypothetical protein